MLERVLRWLQLAPLARAEPHERLLAILVAFVVVLFVATVLFAVLVILVRARHVRGKKRTESLEARWHPVLLEALTGDAPPQAVHERMRRGEEMELLAFLLRFARRLRGEELRVLGTIATPCLDHALAAARSRSPERRAHAVQALAAFGMSAHRSVVLAALDDRSPYVAMSAAQALARHEHAAYAEQVMHRLWRFVDWSTDYLSAMLARIGPTADAPAREILADRGQPARARAVAADVLRRLNDVLAADIAAVVLREESGVSLEFTELQAAALRLLAQVGRAEHLAVVRPFARSSHAFLRAEAVRVLAALGSGGEVDVLSAALADSSTWVAQAAARGLVDLGRTDILRRVAADESSMALVARQALATGNTP